MPEPVSNVLPISPAPELSLQPGTTGEITHSTSPIPLNKFAVLNIEGLKTLSSSSVPYIGDTLKQNDLLFILLTETWLSDHLDAEISIEDYTILRTDRNRRKKKRGRHSGGVAVYIKDDLAASCEILLQFSNGVVEALCIFVKCLNLVICTVYRSPDNTLSDNRSSTNEFQELITQFSHKLNELPTPTPDLLVGGDFNLPKVEWPACAPRAGSSKAEKDMTNILAEFMSEYFLHQLVDSPTHRAGNTLDLIFTNNVNVVVNHEIIPVTPLSSHSLITCQTFLSCPKPSHEYPEEQSTFDKRNLRSKQTNWDAINTEIGSHNWDNLFDNLSVTEMLAKLIEVCENATTNHCPPRSRRKRKDPIPRQRRVLMRKRTKLRKALNKNIDGNRKSIIMSRLIQIESDLQDSYRTQQTTEEEKAVEAIKENPKFFYSYTKSRSELRSSVGPFMDESGEYVNDPKTLADMLSAQYKSVFSAPTELQESNEDPVADPLEDFNFTIDDLMHAISEVGTNSAAGPDRFPAVFLKNCKNTLVHPLFLIWRKSLDTGVIPDLLKTSVITPIFKGGDKLKPKSYRPVALTSHLIKIFEKVIRQQMVKYIEERNLLNPNQHGFRSGHSCLSQLVQHYDKIVKAMEEGINVDVIYLDYAKAFDKLDFNIMLKKLWKMGIRGRVYAWIRSFLSGRHQTVHVKGSKSDPEPVISGVPQGSVVGPLLFLVLLGDIDERVGDSFVSSFADDTRVMGHIREPEDVLRLQHDLDAIYEWSRLNNMQLNAEKFECMRYGYNQTIKNTTTYKACSGEDILVEDTVKDLGVLVCSDATFNEQITSVMLAANLKCGWVLRTFQTRERKLMLTLWKALIQPVLDYCCQLWSPTQAGKINSLEKVQVSFFRKINGMRELAYWQQLQALGTYSLQRRRDRYVVIYIWKVLEDLVPNFGIITSNNSRHGRYCSVPHIRTSAPVRVQNLRFGSLSINGPRLFNAMPSKIRNLTDCSVHAFKNALDKYLKTIPDEPRIRELVPYCSKSSNSLLVMSPNN